MNDSPVKIEAKLDEETSRSLTDAILDVFSPGAELMGWLGDSVRVFRVRSALKCFERTKELAEAQGVELRQPPVKFLSQYIENCSLEDSEDTTLIEWWARILLNASSQYESKHLYFTSVLKQVSSTELAILECVVRNGRRSYRIALAEEAELLSDFQFSEDDIFLSGKSQDDLINKSIESITEELEVPGSLVLDVFVDTPSSEQWQVFHPDYSDEELSSWQILASLQLVKLEYIKFKKNDVHYRVRRATITQLGAEFYFSSHAEEIRDKMSDDFRYLRN